MVCGVLAFATTQAQGFIAEGKIVFEKKIDLRKEWAGQPRYAGVLDKMPRYATSRHTLYFSKNQTLYQKGEEPVEKNPYYSDGQEDDIVFSDLQRGVFTKKQAVFEETILLQDSIRNIPWEMTNETRIIAGFECHKATAILFDSIFVVAFYTNQLLVNGGPMGFSNLPGMILGVAIPRMNLSLFAVRVEKRTPVSFVQPSGGKPMRYSQFRRFLGELVEKRYVGENGERFMVRSLL